MSRRVSSSAVLIFRCRLMISGEKLERRVWCRAGSCMPARPPGASTMGPSYHDNADPDDEFAQVGKDENAERDQCRITDKSAEGYEKALNAGEAALAGRGVERYAKVLTLAADERPLFAISAAIWLMSRFSSSKEAR